MPMTPIKIHKSDTHENDSLIDEDEFEEYKPNDTVYKMKDFDHITKFNANVNKCGNNENKLNDLNKTG